MKIPFIQLKISRTGVLARKEEILMNVVEIGDSESGSSTKLVGFTRRKDGRVSFGNMRKPGRNGANLMIPNRGEFPADNDKK